MVRQKLTAALACAALVLGAAAALGSPLKLLHGRWKGAELELFLDTQRLQARKGTDKPFMWEPLVIKSIRGPLVTFSIGHDTFVAAVTPDTLTLRRIGQTELEELVRVP